MVRKALEVHWEELVPVLVGEWERAVSALESEAVWVTGEVAPVAAKGQGEPAEHVVVPPARLVRTRIHYS